MKEWIFSKAKAKRGKGGNSHTGIQVQIEARTIPTTIT
jgi:hypothetical protein